MRRRLIYLLPFTIVLAFLLALVGLAQNTDVPTFSVYQVLGAQRPSGLLYNQPYDQIAWVNPTGSLELIDATDFSLQHRLYQRGNYNAYRFSPDGRYLAVAIERRLEIWDAQTGELDVLLEPDGALGVEGPLYISDDGGLLHFNSRVPAPQSIRRSENDTSLVAWLWDLRDARGEAPSSLAGRAEALPLFDYRNGFILGPNRIAIAALPDRLQILDVGQRDRPVTAEIVDNRLERDTITAWFSASDDMMYVQPKNSNNLVQVNTATGATLTIPVGRDLRQASEFAALDSMLFSQHARIIGEPNSRTTTALSRLLLRADYRNSFGYNPLTVMLLDVLEPITPTAEAVGMLVFIRDEETGRAVVDFVRPESTNQVALHPDGTHLLVRRTTSEQPLEVYNLATGTLEANYYPNIQDDSGNSLLAYTANGDAILSDFQRFDAATGTVLYEDWNYYRGYDEFLFSPDSQSIYTVQTALSGDIELWEWDIATRTVIRRQPLSVRGNVLEISEDLQRYLASIQTEQGIGVEITDVTTGQRQNVFFESLPGRGIRQILPSPNWQHYLVVYEASPGTQHFPGNEIAIYNLDEGRLWFFAGDDLPAPDPASYSWFDNQTVSINSRQNAPNGPQRVYGIEYDASGLPQCLVDAFPLDYQRWLGLWDLVSARNSAEQLADITRDLCNAVAEAGIPDVVEAYFTPTPVATRVFPTRRPSVIAGVPACLTQRFESEALAYAEEWRNLTADLSPEEVNQLAGLLCEGLTGSSSPNRRQRLVSEDDVMYIDIESGVRQRGDFALQRDLPPQRNINLVADAFQQQYRTRPNNGRLSPDGRFFAVPRGNNRITIYALGQPYDALAATATATNQPLLPDARRIRVRPTATQSFERAGGPRPTLTPTITPTPPPLPDTVLDLPQRDQVQTLCPANTIYTLANPALGYAPQGSLFVSIVNGSSSNYVFNPINGTIILDDTLPACSGDCQPSPNGAWFLIENGSETYIIRPDGSARRDIFTGDDAQFWPDVYWVDADTLEYRVETYVRSTATPQAPATISPETNLFTLPQPVTPNAPFVSADSRISRDPVTRIQRYNVTLDEFSELIELRSPLRINGQDAQIVAAQPQGGPYEIYRLPYRTQPTPGNRYYLVNRNTGEQDYFARTDSGDINFVWHPAGDYLYYRYPNTGSDEWLVYHPATGQHRQFGALPAGTWSLDDRLRIDTFAFDPDDYLPEDAVLITPLPPLYPTSTPTPMPRRDIPLTYVNADELLIPKLQIWDSQTGLTRLYCVPGTATNRLEITSDFTWAPDGRYVAFQMLLPDRLGRETARPSWYVLDTQTGSLTDWGFDIDFVRLWSSAPLERG